MENLLFFTACLSLFLGVLQLFFPNILKQIEEFTDQIFSWGELSPLTFRKISGFTLIMVANIIFYLLNKHNL